VITKGSKRDRNPPGSAARLTGVLFALVGLLMLFVAQSSASEPITIAVLPFGFLDTSSEPRDQRAEHEARLELLSQELHQLLAEGDRFEVVPFKNDCLPEDSDCIIENARKADIDLLLAGAIHKGSSMLIAMWAGAFETKSGERLFFRELSLRGDTDEAWLRGARSLVEDLKETPLAFGQ